MRFELFEALRASTTAIANSRMMLSVARMCLVLMEIQSVQSPAKRMMLNNKVKPAAMIMNAVSCLISSK